MQFGVAKKGRAFWWWDNHYHLGCQCLQFWCRSDARLSGASASSVQIARLLDREGETVLTVKLGFVCGNLPLKSVCCG